ncbi:hypothetical protein HK099_000588 [Clydaea vesicula]|uniref:Minichromosome loss protein Mcl1 middle region domain-containing protein n=1 Tax=Clydaea vesicula TaxID=447962 RepID=A0AAD5XZZ8_9FUNG|nr:hypothetical protein HK099_000588 [Clydaea vesicula]
MRIYVFEADLIDKDKEDFNLIGTLQYHLGASTSITTKGNLIASTSEDNEACTFKLNNNVLVNDKTLIRAKCPVNFLSFDTKGHYCALAMGDGAIKLVNLSDLIQVTNLKGHRKAVKCVCYDPKSDYIASTDAEGSLRIWDVVDLHDTKCVKIIDSFLNPTEKDSENLVRLSWNPSGTYLAVPISNREIAIIEHETWEIIAKIGPHTNADNQGHINFSLNFMNNTDAEEFVDQFTTVEERYLKIAPLHSDSNTNQNGLDVLFDDDDFSDKESDVKKNFISNNKANQQFSAFEDVDNVGQKDKLTEKYLSNTYSISEDEEEKLENSDYEKDISNSNKCRNGQTVNTYSKFSSDQLGKSGIIFACQSSSTHPSTIFFRPIENWSSQNEWMIQFGTDSKEEPTGVALTKTYIVVSTSMNYLRFFSFGGLQLGLLCLQGSAVSMVGCDDYLLVVYHREEQNMGFLLFDNSRKCILKDALPISSTSKLIWIGFSEEGIPMTYDSVGILRGLIRNSESISNSYWLPFLDTRESSKKKKEFYWPVGVIAENFMTVICRVVINFIIFLKIVFEIGYSRPSTTSCTNAYGTAYSSTISQHEYNRQFRGTVGLLLLSQDELLKKEAHGIDTEAKSKFFKIKKELDKIALTLEVSTCKAKKSQLAIDICSILHSETSIDGAIKLALHNNLPVVAEKMSVIKELVDNSKLLQQESLVEEGVLQSQPSVEVITASTQETSVYLNSNKEITQNANFQEPNFEKKKQDVEHDHDTLINGAGGKSEEEKNFIRRKLEEKNNALKTHKVNRIENGSTKYVNPFALNKFQSPATSKADPKESEEVLKKRKLLLNDEGENAKKMKKDKSLQSFFKKSTGLDKNIKSIAKVHAVEVSRQNLNNENTYNENLLNLKKNNPLEVEDDTEAKISTTHTNTDLTANKKSSSFSKLSTFKFKK